MESLFDPSRQHQEVESKIIAALERLSQVFRFLLWEKAKTQKLSPIQIQFLIYLYYHAPQLCRVSQLAKEFRLTPATVSDAIASLEKKKLLYRQPWEQDGRIMTLGLTSAGREVALEVASWADVLKKYLPQISPAEKESVMQFLLQLIESLQKAGIISVARMCFSCRFFQPNIHPDSGAPHHCQLMDKPLMVRELRLDCPEYEAASGETKQGG